MERKRVVITGIGPIASVGIGNDDFWDGIVNERTNVKLEKSFAGKDVWEEYYSHKVPDFNINDFGFDIEDLEYVSNWKEGPVDMDLQFMLASIKLALEDGNIDYKKKSDGKISLIITNENPGMEDFCKTFLKEAFIKLKNFQQSSEKEFYDDIYYKIVKSGYEVQTFMPLFHVARIFCIHNYSLFVNNACAAGLYALEAGADLIKLGKAHSVIVCASDHSNIFKHLWFKMINMYASDGKMRPYASGGGGLVIGEGAAAFILEDYEHAKKRGASIYAEYSGGGFRLEGWKVTTPQLGEPSYQETIQDALINSGTSKDAIDVICGHAPGTTVADAYESQAISSIFGDFNAPVTAFKPYVGHALGASTLIETAILLLAMKNNFLPPVLNTQKVDDRFKIDLVREKRDLQLNTVMKLCCAFAGYNAASIFRKV